VIRHVTRSLSVPERRACKVLEQSRATQRRILSPSSDEKQLTGDIIALATLAKNDVSLVSITENIDYSTPQGRLFTQMLGSFAEYFSGALANHVSKGLDVIAFEKESPGLTLKVWRLFREKTKRGRVTHLKEYPDGIGSQRTMKKRVAITTVYSPCWLFGLAIQKIRVPVGKT
jgi:hypothetical protein